jgi:DNA primase
MLKRWTDEVILAFDSDLAGQAAAVKGCVTAAAAGLSPKVLVLEGGKDASEILEKEGPESLQKVQNIAINGDDFLIRQARGLFDIGSVDGKAKAASFLNPYAAALDSEVKRDAFFDLASRNLRADPRSLRLDYEDSRKGLSSRSGRNAPPAATQGARTPDLVFMLALAANDEQFGRIRSDFAPSDLEDQRARELYIVLEECFRAEERGVDAIARRITDEALRGSVMESAASGEFEENVERFVADGLYRIRRRSLTRRRDRLKESIAELGPEAEGLSDLQYELMHVDTELTSMKDERDERS